MTEPRAAQCGTIDVANAPGYGMQTLDAASQMQPPARAAEIG